MGIQKSDLKENRLKGFKLEAKKRLCPHIMSTTENILAFKE